MEGGGVGGEQGQQEERVEELPFVPPLPLRIALEGVQGQRPAAPRVRRIAKRGLGCRSNQDQRQLCRKLFPLEVWKMILESLYNVDKDTLWSCRYVCRDIKKLADEVQKEKATLWKEKFTKGRENLASFLSEVKGTRISCEADVIRFIADMKNCSGSPFPNGTLIIRQRPREDFLNLSAVTGVVPFRMMESLRCLSAVYGEDILCLVYCLHDECSVSAEFQEITTIFQLRNLRSLVIYMRQWNKSFDELAKLYKMPTVKTVSALQELQIFGKEAVIPFAMMLPLFKKVLPSLTHLRASGANASPFYHRFIQELGKVAYSKKHYHHRLHLVHFERVDLMNPTKQFIHLLLSATFKADCRPLKEISLKFMRPQIPSIDEDVGDQGLQSIGEKLSGIISSLSVRAPALEKMTLNIADELLEVASLPYLEVRPPLTAEAQFLKLKHLTINLTTITLWRNVIKDLVDKKMPNLKEVTLVISENSDLLGKTPKKFYEWVNADMWNLFPASLEVIRVPWFGGWQLKKGYHEGPNFSVY